MRIIKGGLVVNRLDRNNYIVKDAGVGVKISELPVKITKQSIMLMLRTNGIPFDKKSSKNFLENKLETLYRQHFPIKPYEIKPIEVKPEITVSPPVPEATLRKHIIPKPRVRKQPDISL
jgi:hypothetical protein